MMGVLSSLTPDEWDIRFFDDRVEKIDYDTQATLVGISTETYTARRAYEIAARFRERGVPVIIGGYHATACPEETLMHCDSVCIGEAEGVWDQILSDVLKSSLKKRYESTYTKDFAGVIPDRKIFNGKGYIPVALVESGRGCPFSCKFCSISSFYGAKYRRRNIANTLADLKKIKQKYVFLVDDNFTGDTKSARDLMRTLAPLNIKWITQASLVGLEDREFVTAMADSGCIGVLVGFESLDKDNLTEMGKGANHVERYSKALKNLRSARILIYGTFLFGYANDRPESFTKSVGFAIREKMFMAAFNHLVPFPGTPLYEELKSQDRFPDPEWWLNDDFMFGQVPFEPESMSSVELEQNCVLARKTFYSLPSIAKRAIEFRCNCSGPARFLKYLSINYLMRKEVEEKRNIPLGMEDR